MTFTQFLKILRARKMTVLLVLGMTVAVALILSLALPKKYTATAAVVIDLKSPDPILGVMLGTGLNASYMATQVDIITSERVARRVVRQLKLDENPQLRSDWMDDTGGQGDFEAWVATLLSQHLDVRPSRDSNVVSISYKAPDPRFAAALANSFAQSFIDTSVELRVDPAKQYSGFFEARAKDLRLSLEAAQSKLSEYQREKGILISDERLDIENQRLNELTSQVVQLQAMAAESTSRSAQARTSADQLQDVINNPVVAGLRADLSRQQAKLEELNAKLGQAHPQVMELSANIDELKKRVEGETRRVSSSVGINNTITSSRLAEARSSIEAQRIKVAKMKSQRDDAAALIKDVEAAQRAYDAVAQRLTQSSIESQTSQTNIAMLTAATVPSMPSSPKIVLNTVVAVVFGSLLAVGIALLRELTDRRVRGVQDLSESLGVPVLGTLPKPLRGTAAGRAGTLVLPGAVLARLPRPNS